MECLRFAWTSTINIHSAWITLLGHHSALMPKYEWEQWVHGSITPSTITTTLDHLLGGEIQSDLPLRCNTYPVGYRRDSRHSPARTTPSLIAYLHHILRTVGPP